MPVPNGHMDGPTEQVRAQAELSHLKMRRDDLRKEIDELRERAVAMDREVENRRETIDSLTAESEELGRITQSLRMQKEEARRSCEDNYRFLIEADKKKILAKVELKEAESRLKTATGMLVLMEERKLKLSSEIDGLKADRAHHKEDLIRTIQELEGGKDILDDLVKKAFSRAKVSEIMDGYAARLEAFKEENDECFAENRLLRKKIAEHEAREQLELSRGQGPRDPIQEEEDRERAEYELEKLGKEYEKMAVCNLELSNTIVLMTAEKEVFEAEARWLRLFLYTARLVSPVVMGTLDNARDAIEHIVDGEEEKRNTPKPSRRPSMTTRKSGIAATQTLESPSRLCWRNHSRSSFVERRKENLMESSRSRNQKSWISVSCPAKCEKPLPTWPRKPGRLTKKSRPKLLTSQLKPGRTTRRWKRRARKRRTLSCLWWTTTNPCPSWMESGTKNSTPTKRMKTLKRIPVATPGATREMSPWKT